MLSKNTDKIYKMSNQTNFNYFSKFSENAELKVLKLTNKETG